MTTTSKNTLYLWFILPFKKKKKSFCYLTAILIRVSLPDKIKDPQLNLNFK